MPVFNENLEEMKRLGRKVDLLAVPKEAACVSVHHEAIEAMNHTESRVPL